MEIFVPYLDDICCILSNTDFATSPVANVGLPLVPLALLNPKSKGNKEVHPKI